MEMLRHLLSFVFNPIAGVKGKYEPVKIWVNPNDERDFLVMAKLPARQAREVECERIAADRDIIVGSKDGNCQRDALQATTA
eukprot:5893559-Pleurochrysis_carterae.AAC.1